LNLLTCEINGTFITHKNKCIWTEQYITLHIHMHCVIAVVINKQHAARSWDTYHHSHCYNNSLKVNTNVNATNFCFKVSNISLLLHFQCILKYIQYYTKTRYQELINFSICIFYIIMLLLKAVRHIWQKLTKNHCFSQSPHPRKITLAPSACSMHSL